MNEIILYALFVILILAAIQDLAMLKISNTFSAMIIILFGVWLFSNGLPSTIWQNGVFFAIMFGIGLLLFAVRWLGGGDVKLLMACAMWFNLAGGLSLLAYTALAGGILSLVLIFGRRLVSENIHRNIRWPSLKNKGPIPYGIAIAAGMILTVAMHGPNPSGLTALKDINLKAFDLKKTPDRSSEAL